MKLIAILPALLLAGAATAQVAPPVAASLPSGVEAPLVVYRAGTNASVKAPRDFFTGEVRLDPLNTAKAPSRATTAYVTFAPGARTAWHAHPLGQTLVVTSGVGRVQRWGAPVEIIRPGDAVWIPPGVKHWHGAAPTTAMTHFAVTETLDGRNVDWLEPVTDDQYGQ
jgi:quercetin dioxygenase-like cupin family protein